MRKFLFAVLGIMMISKAWGFVCDPEVTMSQSGHFTIWNHDTQFLCLPGYYCPGNHCPNLSRDSIWCEYDSSDPNARVSWTDNCPNEPVCPSGNCGITKCPDGTTSNAGAVSVDDCFAAVTEISCNAGTYLPANGTSCTQCPSNSYCPGGDYTPDSTNRGINSCPSNYPNSDAGATTITQCYSNTKSRTWTGSQIACSVPAGCLSATCNECSGTPCNYTVYSNSNGNGDGTLRSGCSTNNASCQQTIGNAIADANYYANGTSCTACPSGTFSPSGSTSIDDCGHILHVGDETLFLHKNKETTPSLNVRVGNDVFYASMAPGDIPIRPDSPRKLKTIWNNTVYSIYEFVKPALSCTFPMIDLGFDECVDFRTQATSSTSDNAAGTWSVTFPYGTISGVAECRPNDWGGTSSCYCQMTSPKQGEFRSVPAPSCSSDCLSRCVMYVSQYNVTYQGGLLWAAPILGIPLNQDTCLSVNEGGWNGTGCYWDD